MKKLILLELAFLFLATTFSSSPPPPGWYQQTLPVNDFVNDIFFLDSLNGWAVTMSSLSSNDTGYIMQTRNGGSNWNITYKGIIDFTAIQFLDSLFGYACGSDLHSRFLKSTNGGLNWIDLNVLQTTYLKDMYFVNKDTGWVASTDPFDGGLFKTTDGGISWQRQLDETYKPGVVFFLNKDTGWISSEVSTGRLYRTTNGGLNWDFQFASAFDIEAIFFLNGKKGWMRGGPDLQGNGVSYTTDGGFTWISSTGNTAAGFDIKFINDSIGYTGMSENKIPKSTDGGKTWGYQISPIFNNHSISTLSNDTLRVWAGFTGIVHTEDGGGVIVDIGEYSNNEIPKYFELKQNYPNPFNPNTKISYELRVKGYVKITVYDITGKEVKLLMNQKQSEGNYTVEFKSEGHTSGIYFYRIEITGEKSKNVYSETKKMVLTK